ncbi:MAG: winged helix-turn-helix domain-containing protein [Thermofilaceae archaeon]
MVLPVLARKRRNSLEIKFDVLKVISLGVESPTRIMFASNLSWKPLMKILEELLEKDLVRDVGGRRRRFVLTEKGRELLRKYEEIQRTLNEMRRAPWGQAGAEE